MRIGIVGNGVVGQAIARSYLEFVEEVRCYDIDSTRKTHCLNDVIACDLVFVCLPTPKYNGREGCEVGIVEGFFAAFPRSETCFVLKSTVPIGTTRRISKEYIIPNLCHSPEFLTARCAMVDAQIPARNIIGGIREDSGLFFDNDCTQALHQLYEMRFPGTDIYFMSSEDSEALKLIQNAFFATKVGFFNEVYSLCDKLNLDWPCIRDALLADGRISPSHTFVPGPDGKRGFGGMCLPKDLNQLINEMGSFKLPAPILRSVEYRNQEIDRPETV